MKPANEQRTNLISGEWYVENPEAYNKTLVLTKPPIQEDGQWPPYLGGSYLVLQEDGKLMDGYKAECGLDPNIHSWSGKWQYDEAQNSLWLQIEKVEFAGIMPEPPFLPAEDYRKGREYKIVELSNDKMVLARVHRKQ
jgi:hypothetical protein